MQMAQTLSRLSGPSVLCSSGSSLGGLRLDVVELVNLPRGRGRAGSWRLGFVWAASKQKKKSKEKRKSSGGARGQGWSFDALMLVWDDVFDKCCEDAKRATVIRNLGSKGLERYGSGCVLVQETVRTLPRGSASGFSSHSRPNKDLDEPPAYETLQWTAKYVPRSFVRDPSRAPDDADQIDTNGATVLDVTNQVNPDVPLVTQETLRSVLRGMDQTRILGLTADEGCAILLEDDSPDPQAADAGGEDPYNPRNEELVMMLVVVVDGQPAVGADVVKGLPVFANPDNREQLWKLEMRDFHTLPL